MEALATQLPALLGVLVGTLGTILATALSDRRRWKREQEIRWDERRLDAYAAYADALKEIYVLARQLGNTRWQQSSPMLLDRETTLGLLTDAENRRTLVWERVLLLGDEHAISAAREWWSAIYETTLFAREHRNDWEEWPTVVRYVDTTRDRFHMAARRSLNVPGGILGQAEWLHLRGSAYTTNRGPKDPESD